MTDLTAVKRQVNPHAVKSAKDLLARCKTGEVIGFVALYDAGARRAGLYNTSGYDEGRIVLAWEMIRVDLLKELDEDCYEPEPT